MLFLFTRFGNSLKKTLGGYLSNSSLYLTSKEDYYDQLRYELEPGKLLRILAEPSSVQTSAPVHFKGIPWTSRREKVIKQIENARYSRITDFHGHQYAIIFGRTQLAGISAVIQVHFVDKTFVFASYIFEQHTSKDMDIIRYAIRKKFFNGEADPFQGEYLNAQDSEGNLLKFVNDVYPSLQFFNGNAAIAHMMDEILASHQRHKREAEERRVNKLVENL